MSDRIPQDPSPPEIRTLLDAFQHELITPLAIIREYVDLLMEDPDSIDEARRREFLVICRDQVDHLSKMIRDFADDPKS